MRSLAVRHRAQNVRRNGREAEERDQAPGDRGGVTVPLFYRDTSPQG